MNNLFRILFGGECKTCHQHKWEMDMSLKPQFWQCFDCWKKASECANRRFLERIRERENQMLEEIEKQREVGR